MCPWWRGSPWNWVPALVDKKEWWDYRAEKEVRRYLQPSGYNTPTWRTDRRTPSDRKRPRLRKRRAVKNAGRRRFNNAASWSTHGLECNKAYRRIQRSTRPKQYLLLLLLNQCNTLLEFHILFCGVSCMSLNNIFLLIYLNR